MPSIARSLCLRWLAQIKHLPFSDGIWSYSRHARGEDPKQGWKIHVSATIISAEEVFRRVQPILRKSDALFKVPCRLELLMSLNSGLREFSQIGKFLTVYPPSTKEGVALARELHKATRGLDGPRIPFDAHYFSDSLVYYRYGAFRASEREGSGILRNRAAREYRNGCGPGKAVPRWLPDPFIDASKKRLRPNARIGIDFVVFRAKTQRGKGGVYEAIDLTASPARTVIIKEGRRHGETDWNGNDGYARVRHEACVLRRLFDAGLPVPQVIEEFDENGNRYLVLEKIVGRPLRPENRIRRPKPCWQRATGLATQLDSVLQGVHRAGYVWRDCKPEHILMYKDKVYLIDFEGACRISDTRVLPWGSHRYVPPIYRKQFAGRRAGTLEDDYAVGVILFQFLTGRFPPATARLRAAVYERTHCADYLRRKIESLLNF